MREVSCPLLLVRGYGSPVDLSGDPIARRILVPLDGSGIAEHILPHVAEMGRIGSVAVTLLCVEPRGQASPRNATGDALAYLKSTAEMLKNRSVQVSTRLVRCDRKWPQTVLSFAAEQDVDLVAVTTRARDGLGRFTRVRLADVLLQQRGMAVLILPPTATHTEGDSTC